MVARDRPSPNTPVRDWAPYHHTDYACDLLDPKLVFNGDEAVSQWRINLAAAHVAVAQAKMTGFARRGR